MLKVFSFCAVIIGSMLTFQACNKNVADNVTPQNSQIASLEAIEEVFDDTDPGARSAAADPIDKANKVYQVFTTSSPCSTTGTNTSVRLAVTTQTISASTLPDSTVKSKNGYSLFSVKAEKFGQYLKKTVDKSKSQTYFMKEGDGKTATWKKVATIPANGATFTFMPNYYKQGLTMTCTSSSVAPLN
ncbi:hypothetical protein HNV11_23745 (plasmid) [Spirosoma taeanense]|uniref:Lipoprotein n=1 Tax=Spirosoma taeanense TaxID=2735870 RepID=A0A6M5YEU1_9BACT|nr:hypothetical protein [Spirosoma taeanense]QJW92488.1 hypothetical protein HNV11_23745 [Spirosoma taeanense]